MNQSQTDPSTAGVFAVSGDLHLPFVIPWFYWTTGLQLLSTRPYSTMPKFAYSTRPWLFWSFLIIAEANNDRYPANQSTGTTPHYLLTTANSPFVSFLSAIFKLEYSAWISFAYFVLNHLILISNFPSCGLGEYWCTGACFEFFGLGRYWGWSGCILDWVRIYVQIA